jgi:hypothetical protein
MAKYAPMMVLVNVNPLSPTPWSSFVFPLSDELMHASSNPDYRETIA